MIVVDASGLIELVMRTPVGARVEARLFDEPAVLVAPQLLDVEVVQVLRRFEARAFTRDRVELHGERAIEEGCGMRRFPGDGQCVHGPLELWGCDQTTSERVSVSLRSEPAGTRGRRGP